MSNYRALGFSIETRQDAEALARLPLRRAPGHLRLVAGRSVIVHRLEVGDGIELWTVQDGAVVMAAYPAYLPEGRRREVIERVTFPSNPLLPMVLIAGEPPFSVQVVNYLFCPDGVLGPGTEVELALGAMIPGGFEPTGEPAGLHHPEGIRSGADNWQRIVGTVRARRELTNALTGIGLTSLELDAGPAGVIEAVGPTEGATAASPGARVAGTGTLRAAVTGLP